MFGINTYEEDVELFKKVSATEANELLSNEDIAIVYIGRESCPFCRKFAKKLSGLVDEIKSPIYYVDSDNYLDEGINSFRDQYNIVTVPGFVVSKNSKTETHSNSSDSNEEIIDIDKSNTTEVRCDSSLSEEEILNLVK